MGTCGGDNWKYGITGGACVTLITGVPEHRGASLVPPHTPQWEEEQ